MYIFAEKEVKGFRAVNSMAEGINSFPLFLQGKIEHSPTLKIRVGQILAGTVLEVHADRAVLLLEGVNVVAELETGIIPGEKVVLQVEEVAPGGKILLKKLSWEDGRQDLEQQELEAVLQNFGLRHGKLEKAVVAQLFRNGLPFSEEHLLHLTNFAAANNLSPAEATALVWLWSNNLPLTRETVTAIHNLMENGPDKSSLQAFFAAFSGNLETENINYRQLLKTIENLLVKGNAAPETIADQLSTLFEKLGLNHEYALLQQVATRKKQGLKDAATTLAEEEKVENSLKHLLLKHGQSSETKTAAARGEPVLKMLEEITALQLLNIAGQQESVASTSYFLANWAAFPGEKLLPLFLKIKKHHRHQDDQENILYQIFFLLNTRHLGQVICRLALKKECLTCGFTVEYKEGKKLMDAYLGFLKQRLEHLPWKITIYPTRVSSTGGIRRTWQEEFFTSGPGRVRILDARV
ncbi:MAG: hypothetical protein GX334_09015 [Firmicutes bacterium]|nr:hypothetical protein [Bacillota bacterium]